MKSVVGDSVMTLSISHKYIHSIACASRYEVYYNGLQKKSLSLRILCYCLLEFIHMHVEWSKEGQVS